MGGSNGDQSQDLREADSFDDQGRDHQSGEDFQSVQDQSGRLVEDSCDDQDQDHQSDRLVADSFV